MPALAARWAAAACERFWVLTCSAWRAFKIWLTWSASSKPGMPRNSCSSTLPTMAPVPNSPPSKSTRSNSAVESMASKPGSSASEAFSSRLAAAISLSSGLANRSCTSSSLAGRSRAWSRSVSSSAASASSGVTEGRNTLAVSPGRRARTKRPMAWAKNSGVEVEVAYTPTARRGTSTPSETMRTATIQRWLLAENCSIFSEAPLSSLSTTVGFSPVMAASWRA